MLAPTFKAGNVLTYAGIAFIPVMGGFVLVGLAVKPMKKKPPFRRLPLQCSWWAHCWLSLCFAVVQRETGVLSLRHLFWLPPSHRSRSAALSTRQVLESSATRLFAPRVFERRAVASS